MISVDDRVAFAVRDDFERVWHTISTEGNTDAFQELKIQQVFSDVIGRTYPWAWNSVLKLTSKAASRNRQEVIRTRHSPFEIVRALRWKCAAFVYTMHTVLSQLLICR